MGLKTVQTTETKEPRILLFDIEVSPTIAAVWTPYNTNTVWKEKDWYMLSWSAKWLNESKITTKCLADYGSYVPGSDDDRELVEELWSLLDEADWVIGHNVDKFDVPKCKARFVKHGLDPVSSFKTIDTCKLSRKVFGFFSNKLDDIGQFLGLGQKVSTGGYSLWKNCMAGDKQAFAKMKKYNTQDVKLLEDVYLTLRAWDDSHPNINLIANTSDHCPKCGSGEIVRRGYSVSRIGRAHRFQCKSCKGYSTGSYKKEVEVR